MSRKRLFWNWKRPKWPSQTAKIWPTLLILSSFLHSCGWNHCITLKNWSFKAKSNAQITSEHHPNIFQKVKSTTFLSLKMVKLTNLTNFFFKHKYQPFELKITPQEGIVKIKIIPKQFLKNSQNNLQKARKLDFWIWKWSKWPSQKAKMWTKISF